MGRYVVIGFGKFGSAVARTLEQLGHEVIVIERSAALVDRHADSVTRAIAGDATDPHVLKAAGAAGADGAVISTGENLATSILATLALRDLGVRDLFVKAGDENEARALDALGVTEAIVPEREAGLRLAHRMAAGSVLEYTPVGEGHSIQTMAVPGDWTGKTLRQITPREQLGVQVIAVRCSLTDQLSLPPDPDAPLKDSDALIVAGADAALQKIRHR